MDQHFNFGSEIPGLIPMIWIGGFLISISLGSFYSTLAYRILRFFYGHERKSGTFAQRLLRLLTEPSACESCGTKIKGLALVPVFGYWLAGKKCEVCGAKINPLYAFCEAGFGLAFSLAFFLSGKFLASLVFVVLCGHLLVSATTDWKKFSLDYENLPFIVGLGILLNFLTDGSLPTKLDAIVFGCFLGVFFVIHFLFPQGMGFADAIFAPSFALLSGHPWWILFINSSYVLALAITIGTRKKGQSLRGVPIPMGVYFSASLALTFLAKFAWNSGLLSETGVRFFPYGE
ncbi:peptidase, A24 type IV prepilin peptidase family protein [Leptospira fainei serovar Hurstbridge str. BUT 6]|uniref:Peptidase, A24 type IV prepilin peptidase family protein n=1 Tax=Leptospira fainei serovar Hurstbridge str. BUT 6 TaxID=1193011 RepID=S3V2U1_9LEPT|nr:prepilin peptidase [Leptospira fainei]EPG74949.1 peptidase, A24 type IV prepilin peptidase family protein [Leptospira fainei serovar Hurstbridge str. BUT 6]